MPPTTIESQFQFLISCIRHANNGKVDFEKVAKECSVTSKGAAAKRYERLMKANGLHQPAQAVRDATASSTPRKNASDSNKGKKRTFAEYESKSDNGDDDEELPKEKREPKSESVKEERRNSVMVKQEIPQVDGAYDLPMGGILKYSQFPDHDEDEKPMFSNSLHAGDFEDEIEGKQAGFEKMDCDTFGNSYVGSAAQGSKAMSDSIVIAD